MKDFYKTRYGIIIIVAILIGIANAIAGFEMTVLIFIGLIISDQIHLEYKRKR